MKKKLLVGLLLCLVFACTKENDSAQPVKSEKKSMLKISVSDFIKKTQPIPGASGRLASKASASRDSSLTGISDIYYCMFAEDGSVVSYIHQTSLETNFGTISDSIKPGTYWLTVAASPVPIATNPTWGLLIIPTNNNYISGAFPDIFYKRQLITVAQDSVNIAIPILERIMSRLEVNILDMTSSDSVSVFVRQENAIINLFSGTSQMEATITGNLTIKSNSLGSFSDFIANNEPGNVIVVDIFYKNRTTQSWQTKSIVTAMQKNTQTIISGNLFQLANLPDRVNTEFSIIINKNWNATPNVIHF
jgi:hypothetical protein